MGERAIASDSGVHLEIDLLSKSRRMIVEHGARFRVRFVRLGGFCNNLSAPLTIFIGRFPVK
jgi:hypothetical protein